MAVTEIVRYVDATLGTDDISHGLGSGTAAWKTMNYAESVIDDMGQNSDGDLTATGVTYPEGCRVTLRVSNGTDSTAVTWAGNTTDATHYISIVGDGTYTLSQADDTICTISNVDNMNFDNVLFSITAATGLRYELYFLFANTGANYQITNCSFLGTGASDTYVRGLRIKDRDCSIYVNNCLFYDVYIAIQIISSDGGGTCYAYNCTMHPVYLGVIVGDSEVCKFYGKNSIVSRSASDAFFNQGSGTLQLWNCTSDDATAATYDQGSACQINVTPTFTGLYNLAAIDTNWINAGLDLSDDSYWVLDSVDHEGTRRPDGKWDIGWHEYEAPISKAHPGNSYGKILHQSTSKWETQVIPIADNAGQGEDFPCDYCLVTVPKMNYGSIYVNSSAADANDVLLLPGITYMFPVTNPNKIYFYGTVDDDEVHVVAVY